MNIRILRRHAYLCFIILESWAVASSATGAPRQQQFVMVTVWTGAGTPLASRAARRSRRTSSKAASVMEFAVAGPPVSSGLRRSPQHPQVLKPARTPAPHIARRGPPSRAQHCSNYGILEFAHSGLLPF